MNERKGLVIGIVIVCLAVAAVTYLVLSPRKSAQGAEYEKMKSRSEEMAQKQLDASPPQPVGKETDPVEPLTSKGPQRVGG
jgi:hypothetical protein